MTETESSKVLDNFLVRHLTAQALRYQVGQQMWCGACQGCLDWQDAVSFDVKKPDGSLVYTKVFCGKCWDSSVGRNVPKVMADLEAKHGPGYTREITDGRMFIDEEEVATVQFEGVKMPVTRLLRDGQTIQTEGYRIVIQGCAWVDAVVCHDEKVKKWWVIERETGFSIANGPTRIAAGAAAEKAIRKAGKTRYDEVKAKALCQQARLLKRAEKVKAASEPIPA
jgi:hypothetical protein